MNKNGASVSPWSTPVVISKSSDVPSVVTTLALVLVYIDLIPISSRGGIPYAFRILHIYFRRIESNAFLKSENVITAGRLFFRTSSRMRCKAEIWLTVDLPCRKPFWLNRRWHSMGVRMRLSIGGGSGIMNNDYQ